MIQDREFREICKQVANEFEDITVEDVMEIARDSFEFAQKHISEGSLTPVYFQYLGRFMARPGRRAWLKDRKNASKQ
jgi:peptide subunit release factor RF-3